MFAAFERGKKAAGGTAAWDIYNFGPGKIR